MVRPTVRGAMYDGATLGFCLLHGGCSSGAERLTVAQEVAGSIPVTHPIPNRPRETIDTVICEV
jgi:hypothetical protein